MSQHLTILFWNTNNKPLQNQIANLVRLHNVDILILAEFGVEVETMLEVLNQNDSTLFYYSPSNQCERIHIFSKFGNTLGVLRDYPRLTVRTFEANGYEPFVLGALHLPSKMYMTNFDQLTYAENVHQSIRSIETAIGHQRSLLIGDFNMNPFDIGMVSPKGFNATMSRIIARKISRVFQNEELYYFYNPMWNFLGDFRHIVQGTYNYSKYYQWHLFDQVLIRPALFEYIIWESIDILTTDGQTNFLKSDQKINKNITSDHLPIKITLNL